MNDLEFPILLIEDSPEDYEATVRAVKMVGMNARVFHCANGDDGLDFVYNRGLYSDALLAPRPTIILLDLNLPGTDGRELLAEIKSDERLKTIPVIVLTTSMDARDIERCYQAGANSYIKKAVDFDAFSRTIQRLDAYWFNAVVLPPAA